MRFGARQGARGLVLLISLFLVGCQKSPPSPGPLPGPAAVPALDGGAVGNGGDYLTSLFESGRFFAARILERMTPQSFPEALQSYLTPVERQWLFAHRMELADDIRRSPHLPPVESTPAPDLICAFTQPRPLAAVGFLKECASTVGRSRQAAAVVLIHESVHHLHGPDEISAYHIATTVGLWWIYQGHPESPHWVESSPKPRGVEFLHGGTNDLRGPAHSAWTGTELITWREDDLQIYSPKTDEWRTDKALNNYLDWFKPQALQTTFGFRLLDHDGGDWVEGKVMVFSSCYGSQRLQGAGHSYDPKTKRWELIPEKDAPSSRAGFVHLSLGNRLLIWGGYHCPGERTKGGNSMEIYNDGGIYDPATGHWTPLLPTNGIPEHRSSPAIAWNGKQLFLWGGFGALDPDAWALASTFGFPLKSGAVYDFDTGKWTATPKEGAPRNLYRPLAAWAGDRFLVLSPEQNIHDDIGAAYFPNENAWRPLPRANRPELKFFDSSSRGLIWTQSEAVYVGYRQVSFYSPEEERWQTYANLVQPELMDSVAALDPMEAYWTGAELLHWVPQSGRLFILYP